MGQMMHSAAPARYSVDLHVHTSASDGSDSPADVVARARQLGIQVLGITDHDTVAGLDEAIAASRSAGVVVVPGVELSIANQPEQDFVEIHLLGYFVDHSDGALLDALKRAAAARFEQKVTTVRKLQALGFDVPVDEVLAAAGGGVPGRAHIAEVALARNPGRLRDADQFYRDYISAGGLAYTPRRYQITLPEAVELIRKAGGLPILAHPAAYRLVRDPQALVRRVAALGVAGVEGRYTYDKNRPHFGMGVETLAGLIDTYVSLAQSLGLIVTGGSDYHGARKSIEIGEGGLELNEFADLLKEVAK